LVERFRGRVSGPLLDRIDLHVEVPAVSLKELPSSTSESTEAVAQRVAAARDVQLERFGPHAVTPYNAAMGPEPLRRFCIVDGAGRAILDSAFQKLALSPRGLDGILKVARTIADLAGSDSIRASHLAEAIQYRVLDQAPRH
jgi:magnesium chelatase family protein